MASLPTIGANPEFPIQRDFTSGTKFRNGDALLARITPCLENGKTAFIQILNEETVGWGSTEFIVMRTKDYIPKPFSYLIARDQNFRNHTIQSMTGTSGRQRARTEALAQYPFIFPPCEVWTAFGKLVEPSFSQIRLNTYENQTLAQLRDALLPKLMSGQLRLRTAQQLVEAAV
jgi:type I restriction enzyme S subunit